VVNSSICVSQIGVHGNRGLLISLDILMNLWLLLHGGGLLLLLLFVVRCRDDDDDDGFTNAKLLHLPLLLLSVMVDDFLLLAVSAIKLRMDIDTN